MPYTNRKQCISELEGIKSALGDLESRLYHSYQNTEWYDINPESKDSFKNTLKNMFSKAINSVDDLKEICGKL